MHLEISGEAMSHPNSTSTADKKSSSGRLAVIILVGVLLIGSLLFYECFLRNLDLVKLMKGQNTVESIVAQYGEAAHLRLTEKFDRAALPYPPKTLTMLCLKTEKVLELFCPDGNGNLQYLCTYPILATSGTVGPKLKEGDKQMPEGFYRIREFEPNSSYHVALRLDYPSAFDREKGKQDGREDLGSDIMIHGKDCSIGCLAMGDPASEDLFVLVHDVGLDHTDLIMSPYDFRKAPPGVSLPDRPAWVGALYTELETKIRSLPAPK
jgi:murein L,D-transpeptidase YafK